MMNSPYPDMTTKCLPLIEVAGWALHQSLREKYPAINEQTTVSVFEFSVSNPIQKTTLHYMGFNNIEHKVKIERWRSRNPAERTIAIAFAPDLNHIWYQWINSPTT